MTRRVFSKTRDYFDLLRERKQPSATEIVSAADGDDVPRESVRTIDLKRSALHAAYLLLALDLKTPQEVARVPRPLNGHAIRHAVNALNAVDDQLEMIPSAELAQVAITHGTTLNPYLDNLFTDQTRDALKGLSVLGLVSKEELNAFANLTFEQLVKEAQAVVKLEEQPDSMKARKEVVQAHLDASAVYLALLSHSFKHDERLKTKIDSLSLEDLEEIYPKGVNCGRSIQMIDDFKDWIRDYTDKTIVGQSNTSRFSNSTLLAFMENGVSDEDMRTFIENYSRSPVKDIRKLPEGALPKSIGSAIETIKSTFDRQHATEGELSCKIYDMLFKNILRGGFPTEKPVEYTRGR